MLLLWGWDDHDLGVEQSEQPATEELLMPTRSVARAGGSAVGRCASDAQQVPDINGDGSVDYTEFAQAFDWQAPHAYYLASEAATKA